MDKYNKNFEYSQGELLWKVPGKRRVVGSPAGSLRKDGYLEVGLNGKRERVHRVIWKMHNGEIPEGYIIDHIDGNPLNNLLENLRCIPKGVNQNNRKNLKKAYLFKRTGKWQSAIRRDGKKRHLGYFDTEAEACLAYDLAKAELDRFDEHTFYGEQNHPIGDMT